GKLYTDYIYPHDNLDFRYFSAKHVSVIRLPIRWERIQPTAFGPLSTTDTDEMKAVLQTASLYHMQVILDIHNYGRYYDTPLTKDDTSLADLWTKMAAEFKDTPGLYGYELMNEPHDLPGESDTWSTIAQNVTTAIRTVDEKNVIIIPGYNWQNAQNWSENNSGLLITDPNDNLIYAAHIYFDSTHQGVYAKSFSDDHQTTQTGVTDSQDFRDWLAKNNVKGMFTEFGVPGNDSQWLETMDAFLQTITKDTHIVGAVYWGAGPWWGDYPLSIEPIDGADRPQMQILSKYAL
ncbi:MAG TPA: glycoside hydrolase family 5 protein, partial [Candidatus Saccharimonadales bacterium]|nr:glycoside hydrolase family 5 protein [Candidatus Saccharimonadales bacterium]